MNRKRVGILVFPDVEVLDFCDTTQSTEKRLTTSIAPQALTLFNGDFVNRQARHLAARLLAEAGPDPTKQVERAYRLALCRPATASETAAMTSFLIREAERLKDDAAAIGQPLRNEANRQLSLEQMCRVIFNLNEFVYAD